MTKISICFAMIILFLTGACGTSPEEIEKPATGKDAVDAKLIPLKVKQKNTSLNRVLIDINLAQTQLAKYQPDATRTEVHRRIVDLLRYLRDISSRHLPELLDYLAEGNQYQRVIAAWAVGWPREEIAIQPLLNALRDPEPSVVKAACLGLQALSLPKIPVQPLIELAENSPKPGCRSNAVLALASLATHNRTNKLLKRHFMKWLEHTDARMRLHSLVGLSKGRMAVEQDIPALAKMVMDPKPAIRKALVMPLYYTGSVDAMPTLIELVSKREPNPNVRLYARKALAGLGGKDVGEKENAWKKIYRDMKK